LHKRPAERQGQQKGGRHRWWDDAQGMGQDRLNYERMIDDALRGVVRRVLASVVEKKSLPGAHHFLITFKTDYPGVDMPDYLRERYPDTISIMLQYEFWNLEVDEQGFSVGLSFNDKQEMLTVPFGAVTGFVDPFAKFRLEFQARYDGDSAIAERRDKRAVIAKPIEAPKPAAKEAPKDKAKSGEVVTLDAFRKK
jgi:uncharacterized protein